MRMRVRVKLEDPGSLQTLGFRPAQDDAVGIAGGNAALAFAMIRGFLMPSRTGPSPSQPVTAKMTADNPESLRTGAAYT